MSKNVYIFLEKITLGECLNYGIQKVKHKLIAKFDDDDFYSKNTSAEEGFMIYPTNWFAICGLLEIPLIVGSIFTPKTIGVEQADSATFFRFKDFLSYESKL
ncbi:TPA: hypothetical protein ACJMKJ_005291 [Bacillus wiedmannii]